MMRTVSTSFLILSSLLGFIGCGDSGSNVDSNSTTTAATIDHSENTVASENSDAAKAESDANPEAETKPENRRDRTASTGGSGGDSLPPPLIRPSDGVVDISFDDIKLPIQEDMVFRPFMLTDRARELDGKRIRISGYMLPDTKTRGITEFVLLKNTECKFGPGGQADHLLSVKMIPGEDTRFRDDPISVEGTLTIKPFQGPDGNTWSIYDLACERVTRYQTRR